LPRSVLDIPPLGCVNVHPSLLPLHRGAAPISSAILAGNAETGVSIMLMDPGMDTGPILSVQQVPLADEDDQVTLTSHLALLGADLLADTLEELAAGRVTPRAQDADHASISRPVARSDAVLDWTQPAVALWRQVRAFAEWPQATTWWKGRSLRILAASYEDEASPAQEPGAVSAWGPPARSPQAIAIATGAGVLLPRVVGLEGKRAMPMDVFLRGQAGIVGARLENAPSRRAAPGSTARP
jgi:methionyl-tRNA formyltransferase